MSSELDREDALIEDKYGTIEKHVGACKDCDLVLGADGTMNGFDWVENELASHIDDRTPCYEFRIDAVYADGGERRVA